MIHTRVADSALLTRDAVGEKCGRFWALRKLVEQFAGRVAQTGSKGHDPLEDTFATREAVLRCLRNPSGLRAWALSEREIIAQKKTKSVITSQSCHCMVLPTRREF
ncbi:uncharacterized protein BDV17DRAFT_208220 [Aspergillus undulatus]|uniref:uncharacterized protein n=1 Tax=Aspergillus undulatus TaxID=1810928 RepID=UPI003CCE101F